MISKMEGKSIVTVEGLSEREKKYMHMHLAQSELFSVVFVFRVWSCVRKDFWM